MDTSSFIKNTLVNSKKFENVVAICKDLLKTFDLAGQTKEYLNARITLHNQQKFDFGYFPGDEDLNVLIDKVGLNTLKSLGLIYPDKNNPIVMTSLLKNHNLIMPIKDDYGYTVALVGRSLYSEEEQKAKEIQKYKYTNGYKKSNNLFGLCYAKKAIRNTQRAIVVEGQIDCITCHSYGLHNTVALGGSSMGDYQIYLLMKSGVKDIYLLLDNDEAGRKGSQKIIDKFSKYLKFHLIKIPDDYKDIDQYLRNSKNHNALNELF